MHGPCFSAFVQMASKADWQADVRSVWLLGRVCLSVAASAGDLREFGQCPQRPRLCQQGRSKLLRGYYALARGGAGWTGGGSGGEEPAAGGAFGDGPVEGGRLEGEPPPEFGERDGVLHPQSLPHDVGKDLERGRRQVGSRQVQQVALASRTRMHPSLPQFSGADSRRSSSRSSAIASLLV